MKEKSGPSSDKVNFPSQTQTVRRFIETDSVILGKVNNLNSLQTDGQRNICRYTAVLRCLKSIAISQGKVFVIVFNKVTSSKHMNR